MNMLYYVLIDKDGYILSHGTATKQPPGSLVISKQEYFKIKSGNSFILKNDIVVSQPRTVIDLETLKRRAVFKIESEAELARNRILSKLHGESIEFLLTFREAELYAERGSKGNEELDALAYPLLHAESIVSGLTIPGVVLAIDDISNYCRSALAKIKLQKIQASMRVALVDTKDQIDNLISALEWPQPKSS